MIRTATCATLILPCLCTEPDGSTRARGTGLRGQPGAPQIQAGINSVPPVPQGWPWNHNSKSFDPSSNYNLCATLSAVIITVEQGTDFHRRTASRGR